MKVYQTLNTLIPPKAWGSSVSIVIAHEHEKELHQFGTGTLLKVSDDTFLVTAAHVVTQAYEHDKAICVATGNSFTQIYGNWYCSSESDPFDVALLRLPADVISKLREVSYIRLQDIEFRADLSKGIFCLFGYPNRLSTPSIPNKVTMSLKPFQYMTYLYEGETNTLGGYQEKYHLLLDGQEEGRDIDGHAARFCDSNGNPLRFPKDLSGISGCSVWKIGNRDRHLSEWGRYRPKIVAVQTGVYSDAKVIKATRWVAISTLLHEAYPELRPALNLWHVEY